MWINDINICLKKLGDYKNIPTKNSKMQVVAEISINNLLIEDNQSTKVM